LTGDTQTEKTGLDGRFFCVCVLRSTACSAKNNSETHR